MFKTGFTTVTFRKLSRREICEIAFDNKLKYLEWGGDIHLPPNDKNAVSDVKALQDEFGLKSLSYGSYYHLGQNDMSLWKDTVETAYSIGAPRIRIWQGNLSSCDVSEEQLQDMVYETKQLADIAAEKNLKIAFEFHNHTNNDTAESCINFLEAVGKSNVKTYWQPFSFQNDNKTLQKVLPYVDAVHVFTWRRDGKRYSLKYGEKKWKNFLNTIKANTNEPDLILEFVKNDSTEQFRKDANVLKKWVEDLENNKL